MLCVGSVWKGFVVGDVGGVGEHGDWRVGVRRDACREGMDNSVDAECPAADVGVYSAEVELQIRSCDVLVVVIR